MSNISLGQEMSSLDVGLRQAAYTGVRLIAGQDDEGNNLEYFVGNTNGNVLEITVPNGTKDMAQSVLDGLRKRGFRYQPYESDTTYTDPAIEIGDNVTVSGNASIVQSYEVAHSRLMAPTLSAPYDEEVDHEFKYETRIQRQFKRESAYARARLTINANAIEAEVARASAAEGELSGRVTIQADRVTAEVARATEAEGTLRSNLTIQADRITAEVTRATTEEGTLQASITANATEIAAKVSKTGGNASSFGWSLTDSSWELKSNNSTVFRVTSGGAEVSGKITATSGYIGNGSSGFEIGSTYIRNGMTSFSDTTNNGIFIGTNGISLGGGKFKVDSAGNLTATSGTFSGSVHAGSILYGGNYGTMGGGGITAGTIGTGAGTPLSVGAVGGINGGTNFNKMDSDKSYWPSYLCATNQIVCNGEVSGNHWYGKIMDANETTHSTMWQQKKPLDSATFQVTTTVYWTDNDDRNLSAISAAKVNTSTLTINHLGY